MKMDCQAFPRAVTTGLETEIVLRGTSGPGALAQGRSYTARFFSRVNRSEDIRFPVTLDAAGAVRCRLAFRSAGEYCLHIFADGEELPVVAESFFAVAPEMARLRPFKGDLHMHTTGSDGKESALTMALASRKSGMDFIAITDHDNQPASIQAADEVRKIGLDLVVIPGEEVTIPESGGHILSLNAAGWISNLRRRPEYEAERDAIIRNEIGDRALLSPLTQVTYAHAVWTIRKIRELGGCVIMAHPYWVGTGHRFYPPPAMAEQLLQDGLCDGVELMGGSPTTEGNRLCVARYGEELLKGRRLAITGGSDAHGTGDIGHFWTMVFAETLDVTTAVRAVLERRSVACDQRTGPDLAIYGPFDLVEYAYFLHREFFPLHDDICRSISRVCSEPASDAGMRRSSEDALASLRQKFWHTPGA